MEMNWPFIMAMVFGISTLLWMMWPFTIDVGSGDHLKESTMVDNSILDAAYWANELIKSSLVNKFEIDEEILMGWFANYRFAVANPLQSEICILKDEIGKLKASQLEFELNALFTIIDERLDALETNLEASAKREKETLSGNNTTDQS